MKLGSAFASVAAHSVVLAALWLLGAAGLVRNEASRIAAVVPVDVVNLSDITNVAALAPERTQDIAPAPESAPPPVAPAPTDAPEPASQERRRPELDLDALSRDLLENRTRGAPESPDNARRGAAPRQAAGLSQGETAALQDRIQAILRAHLRRCWREPVDARNPGRLVVVVRLQLDRTGRLRGQPGFVTPPSTMGVDPELRAAMDAAMRAVRECNPYPLIDDVAVARHPELWRELEYEFVPGS